MTNREKFVAELTKQYEALFKIEPDYAFAAARNTPAEWAEKMTSALSAGTANKAGHGVSRTCKALDIPHTYQGILIYLNA